MAMNTSPAEFRQSHGSQRCWGDPNVDAARASSLVSSSARCRGTDAAEEISRLRVGLASYRVLYTRHPCRPCRSPRGCCNAKSSVRRNRSGIPPAGPLRAGRGTFRPNPEPAVFRHLRRSSGVRVGEHPCPVLARGMIEFLDLPQTVRLHSHFIIVSLVLTS